MTESPRGASQFGLNELGVNELGVCWVREAPSSLEREREFVYVTADIWPGDFRPFRSKISRKFDTDASGKVDFPATQTLTQLSLLNPERFTYTPQ